METSNTKNKIAGLFDIRPKLWKIQFCLLKYIKIVIICFGWGAAPPRPRISTDAKSHENDRCIYIYILFYICIFMTNRHPTIIAGKKIKPLRYRASVTGLIVLRRRRTFHRTATSPHRHIVIRTLRRKNSFAVRTLRRRTLHRRTFCHTYTSP